MVNIYHPEQPPIVSELFFLSFDYLGVAIFALSGGLVAQEKRMDVLGFAFLGCLAGIGGGTIRDLLLDRAVFWLNSPGVILAAAGVSVMLFFFRGMSSAARSKAIKWLDAIGLAGYCVLGAAIALGSGATGIACIMAGFFTAVGGGLLRDIVAGRPPYILTGGEFYGGAALAGASVFLLTQSLPVPYPHIIGFVTALLVRAGGIYYGWGFPVYEKEVYSMILKKPKL